MIPGSSKNPLLPRYGRSSTFYPAKDTDQNYAQKNPREYQHYKKYSGRESFLEKTWKAGTKVRVYSTPRCHNCHEIKEYLRSKNVEFVEIDLASDEDARDMIVAKTGHLGAPIVQIGNEFIFGYDPKKMEILLN